MRPPLRSSPTLNFQPSSFFFWRVATTRPPRSESQPWSRKRRSLAERARPSAYWRAAWQGGERMGGEVWAAHLVKHLQIQAARQEDGALARRVHDYLLLEAPLIGSGELSVDRGALCSVPLYTARFIVGTLQVAKGLRAPSASHRQRRDAREEHSAQTS